ncbi:hypothetical protein SDC9_126166 [bioreactor metagenome]|uniref:Uncharacterized protein n=1 Tax=bioreactor metagenome TaxID=1076179 RepID=A0A645CQF8_9ZZZZ
MEVLSLLKSASNACPIASCSRIPEPPAPITTGISPPSGRIAPNKNDALSTASFAISSIKSSDNISNPILKLRDDDEFSVLPFSSIMHVAITDDIGRLSAASTPNELKNRTSEAESEILPITFTTRLSRAKILSFIFCK